MHNFTHTNLKHAFHQAFSRFFKELKMGWFTKAVWELMTESTIHGMKYIVERNRHFIERVMWVLAVLGGVAYSAYMVEEQVRKYLDNPVIISFQPKQTAIERIPFPAITICNINVLKKNVILEVLDKLDAEIERAKHSTAWSDGVRDGMLVSEHLSHYCLSARSFRRAIDEPQLDMKGLEDIVKRLNRTLNGIKTNGTKAGLPDMHLEELSEELRKEIKEFKKRAMHNCEDMVLRCRWARKVVSCKKLFKNIYTQHGSCCVMNMMPKFILRKIPEDDHHAEDEIKKFASSTIEEWKDFAKEDLIKKEGETDNRRFPISQKAGGRPHGLSIMVNPELETYGSCNTNDGQGFKIVAHSPISFPNIADYGVVTPIGSEQFINIQPEVTTAKIEELEKIDPDQRGCFFPNDSKLNTYKFYTADNCMDECIARITYENCSCVRYFMPKNSSQQLCGATKLPCSQEVRENITIEGRTNHCPECKPACTEIKYKMQVSQFKINWEAPFKYNTSNETRSATQPSIIHIYIGTDSIYAKMRTTLYDTSDIIANAGGILGLSLGFSIISVVEFIYFVTLRAWFNYNDAQKRKDEDSTNSRSSMIPAVTRNRINEGLPEKDKKAVGYYNWARTASTVAKVDVVSGPETRSRRRGVPDFNLLSGNNGKTLYPYLA